MWASCLPLSYGVSTSVHVRCPFTYVGSACDVPVIGRPYRTQNGAGDLKRSTAVSAVQPFRCRELTKGAFLQAVYKSSRGVQVQASCLQSCIVLHLSCSLCPHRFLIVASLCRLFGFVLSYHVFINFVIWNFAYLCLIIVCLYQLFIMFRGFNHFGAQHGRIIVLSCLTCTFLFLFMLICSFWMFAFFYVSREEE